MSKKQKKLLLRIAGAALLSILLYFVGRNAVRSERIMLLLFLAPYLLVGHDILRKAFRGICRGKVFNENFLMTVATLGAVALGEYVEGVAVMLLYQVGELFQSYAVDRSRRNIAELMDIRPDYANIETDGVMQRVSPDEVEPGSIIVVQPGERVPLDGVVVQGASALDTGALTGESRPVDVQEGSEVLSGSINISGVVRIRTTRGFEESTASRILDLVENAASNKAESENFISKFARVYTPVVCFAALALAVLPPVICMLAGLYDGTVGELWGKWLLRACTFLVISCPCALVISVPLSFFAGLGGAGRQGILIKGSNYIETLAKVRTVVFDKTGTITKGNFAVAAVHHSPLDEGELLEYAALAECHSSHPISLSLRQAYGRHTDPRRVSEVRDIGGHGVIALVDGKEVAVGNERLMDRVGAEYRPCSHDGTIVHVAMEGAYCGHIVISDEIKESSAQAVAALRKAGVTDIVMLTGDSGRAAERIAAEAGISDFRSGLLPEDKVRCVEELLRGCAPGRRLAFVGDGVNDAPVLSRSDVGIAMGALGSDAAIEAADVVLMDDDPMKIAGAVRMARRCLGIVKQNIVFSLAVKLICLILAGVGLANMWVAVAADVGVMILAVGNAVRCLFVEKLQ